MSFSSDVNLPDLVDTIGTYPNARDDVCYYCFFLQRQTPEGWFDRCSSAADVVPNFAFACTHGHCRNDNDVHRCPSHKLMPVFDLQPVWSPEIHPTGIYDNRSLVLLLSTRLGYPPTYFMTSILGFVTAMHPACFPSYGVAVSFVSE